MKRTAAFLILLPLILISSNLFSTLYAQGTVRWLKLGSMENWYSEYGCEIEIGNLRIQQYGLRWPALYDYQDTQAAKALWLGARDFTDQNGSFWSHKVAHVGPRVNGAGEFFPKRFDYYSKYEAPRVTVDGTESYSETPDFKGIDPSLSAERVMFNEVNTVLGITMRRTIMAWSQEYHDNYHIIEYVFKNTGYVDDSNVKVLSDTVKGFYAYFLYRLAICRQTQYIVAQSSGWGTNTMNDFRGVSGADPATTDPMTGQQDLLRAQFSWHGRHANANVPPSDNIGAPIWNPTFDQAGLVSKADTLGRLGAPQFAGSATLFVSKSPQEYAVDDTLQPSTTSWEGSDEPNTSNNSHTNRAKMTSEYTEWIQRGHKTPRHAWTTEPTGMAGFLAPKGDPALGTPGGWSNAIGYGPYDLAPGDSIRIVVAEGVSGLSRLESRTVGARYKYSGPQLKSVLDNILYQRLADGSIRGVGDMTSISALQKNDSVIVQGHNRLFETFRRARANWQSGYAIVTPPQPPASFTVTGLGDRVSLSWESSPSSGITAYEIYRARGARDSTYHWIYTASPTETSFNDTTALRGDQYFYYITAVAGSSPVPPNSPTREPSGVVLRSNQLLTQTYDPTFLKRAAGTSLSQIRIAPNPYVISANEAMLRFPGEKDKIAFFNIPGRCRIKIFTEIGELIKEIEHTDGSGDEYWNSVTSSGQVVVSGLYIIVFENMDTGERTIQKLVVIR